MQPLQLRLRYSQPHPILDNPRTFHDTDVGWCEATGFTLHKSEGLLIHYTATNGSTGSITSGAFPGSEASIDALVNSFLK